MVKLILKNFRCWHNHTFSFPDSGFVLLKAPSGFGKTTILNAIQYVLYGDLQKVSTYNESKTSVELYIKDLYIKRTNRPKRLTLKIKDGEYEDESAQAIIYEKYGKNFNITSYITQKNVVSFLTLSAAEKMTYLQNIIADQISNMDDKVKLKLKESISSKKNELTRRTNEHEYILSEFSKYILPTEPENPLSKPYTEKRAKKFEEKVKSLKEEIKDVKITLTNLQKQIKEENELDNKINICENDIQRLNLELEDLVEVSLPFDINVEKKKRKDTEDNLKEKKKEMTRLENEERQNIENIKKVESLKQEYANLLNKREELEKDKKVLDYEGDEFLEELKGLLDYFNKTLQQKKKEEELGIQEKLLETTVSENDKKLKTLKESLDEIQIIHDIQVLETKLKKGLETRDTKNKLLKEKTKILEIRETKTTLQELQTTLEKLNIDLERLQQSRKIRKCPGCGVCVRIDNDNLVLSDYVDIKRDEKELKQEITNTKEDIKRVSGILTEKEAIEKKIKELETLLSNNREYEDVDISNTEMLITETRKSLRQKEDILLQINKFSREDEKRIQKSINNLKEDIKKLKPDEEYDETDYTRDEVMHEITVQEEKKRRQSDIDKRLSQIEKQITNFVYPKVVDIDYKTLIENIRKDIVSLEEEMKVHHENLKSIEKYEDYIDKKNKLNSQLESTTKTLETLKKKLNPKIKEELENTTKLLTEKEQLQENYFIKQEKLNVYKEYMKDVNIYEEKKVEVSRVKNLERECERDLGKLTKLYTKILEAESLLLTNILEELNDDINKYLSQFFPNDSITINISAFKETKKDVKPGINIDVGYKGNTTDINALSGGEYDRVVLSFVLAFNNVLGNDLLLLDESIASLDMELTSDILEVLYENLDGKLVILVAHQISEGIFDKVIDLEKHL